VAEAVAALCGTACQLVRVTVSSARAALGCKERTPTSALHVDVRLPRIDFSDCPGVRAGPCPLAELAVKYVFNAISTAACIVKGLVFSNRMINMGVSNNKLFFRAIRIIQGVTDVDAGTARGCLLSAIHGLERDEVAKRERDDPKWAVISHHVIVATPKPLVLPHAILLASDSTLTYAAAQAALKREPLLRAHVPAK